jgi:UDP-N-acetylglucosamine enolpyruvyl transferase
MSRHAVPGLSDRLQAQFMLMTRARAFRITETIFENR